MLIFFITVYIIVIIYYYYYLSIHPSIHPSIQPSIHPSIHIWETIPFCDLWRSLQGNQQFWPRHLLRFVQEAPQVALEVLRWRWFHRASIWERSRYDSFVTACWHGWCVKVEIFRKRSCLLLNISICFFQEGYVNVYISLKGCGVDSYGGTSEWQFTKCNLPHEGVLLVQLMTST